MSNVTKKLIEAYLEISEKKKLDPVDAKALKGKHDDREDGDIDNDGDEDESDEYLHNRRKAVKKAMDEGKEECPKCEGEGCDHCDDKGYHKVDEAVEPLDEAAMKGNYAKVIYDYREDYYFIRVYKNGKQVAEDDGYFGANEKGNPLIKKFTDLVKKAKLNPEGMPIVNDDGKKGVFKANKFNWNVKEEVSEAMTISRKMAQRALANVKAQPKDKVSLKKAPWDKDKKSTNEEEVVMNPKQKKDQKGSDTMANEEVELEEGVIDQVKDIVAKKQAKKISGVWVDGITASAISQIYDKVNDANKAKLDKLPITKLAAVAMKMIKRESVELDESALPSVYARILENRAKQTKGATAPEGMMDNSKSSKGAMDMANQPVNVNDDDEKGHDDASKAGRASPNAKARSGDNMKGDKKVIPSATKMKG